MVSQTLSMTAQKLMLTSMLTTRDVRLQVTAEELVTMEVPITAVLTITGGTGTGDAGEKSSDSTESGTNVAMIGGIGFGVVIIIILTFLIVRKGRAGDNLAGDAFANAAFNQHMDGMVSADAGISPEQLQYEQQLIAHGYTPEQARAYADQYFRPHMVQ